MTDLLRFVRGLLEDAGERRAYAADPAGYTARHGRSDLSGEDVAEAVAVVRHLVATETAEHLDRSIPSAPPAAPEPGEEPFAAALRLLGHHLDGLGAEPVGAEDREPPPDRG